MGLPIFTSKLEGIQISVSAYHCRPLQKTTNELFECVGLGVFPNNTCVYVITVCVCSMFAGSEVVWYEFFWLDLAIFL